MDQPDAEEVVVKRPRGRPPKRKRDGLTPSQKPKAAKKVGAPSSATKPPPPKRIKRSLSLKQQLRQQPYRESDDDGLDDEDEERSYQRSIKERMMLAESERREAELARERFEQKRINSMFFLQNRKNPEQQAKMVEKQQLVNCDLWNPPADFRPPKKSAEFKLFLKEFEEEAEATAENNKKLVAKELAIPDFSDTKMRPGETWNTQITTKFYKDYQAGLIITTTPEEFLETTPVKRGRGRPPRSSLLGSPAAVKTPIKSRPSTPSRPKPSSITVDEYIPGSPKVAKLSRIGRFFHPTRWTAIELRLFQELVQVYGREWATLSHLLGKSKTSSQLKRTFHKAAGTWKSISTVNLIGAQCGVCQEGFTRPMVFCDGCDRAYHLTCTHPPLSKVPTDQDWFCSPECSLVSQTKCEVCGSSTDDASMLLCDKCNLGYHIYCLPSPLKAIPTGDWFCQGCTPRTSGRAGLRGSSNAESDTEREKGDKKSEADKKKAKCDHKVPAPVAPGKLKRVVINYQAPKDQAVKLAIASAHSLSWKTLVQLARFCVECMTEATGDVAVPSDLSLLAVEGTIGPHSPEIVSALLPNNFDTQKVHAATIFKSHVDDISIATHPLDENQLTGHFQLTLQACAAIVDKLVAEPSREDTPALAPVVAAVSATPLRRVRVPHTSLRPGGPKKSSDSSTKTGGSSGVSFEEFNKEDGYADNENRYWIFQANPTLYDVVNSVKSLPDMTWFVKQHINRIRKGDKVFVWEAGKDAGVIATGLVKSDPEDMAEARGMKQFCIVLNLFDSVQLRCKLHIDKVIPEKIRKPDLKTHAVLSSLTILRAPIGTNFRITKHQGQELEKLVEKLMKRGGGIVHPDANPIASNMSASSPPKAEKPAETEKTPRRQSARNKPDNVATTTTTTTTTTITTTTTTTTTVTTTTSPKGEPVATRSSTRRKSAPAAARREKGVDGMDVDENEEVDIMTVEPSSLFATPARRALAFGKKSAKAAAAPATPTPAPAPAAAPVAKAPGTPAVPTPPVKRGRGRPRKFPIAPVSAPVEDEDPMDTTDGDYQETPSRASAAAAAAAAAAASVPEPEEEDVDVTALDHSCSVCHLKTDAQVITCAGCGNGYHLACHAPKLSSAPEEAWYCASCTIDANAFKNLQQVIALREIRFEAVRLAKLKAEYIMGQHRNNVQTLSEPADLHGKMKELVEELQLAKASIVDAANECFTAWQAKLLKRKLTTANY